MLRSLVGSEMCIRDRAEVGRLRAEPADPAGDARGSGTGILSRGRSGRSREPDQAVCDGARHTCLLYTSDAADDLPCVDLGSRRIIKKKNTHTHTHTQHTTHNLHSTHYS